MRYKPVTKPLDRRGISITGVPGKNDQIFSAAFIGKGKPIQCTEYVCTCDSQPLYTADRINNENNNKLEQDYKNKRAINCLILFE